MNKVVNVNMTGGIIGLLSDAPARTLAQVIAQHNAEGWRVVQVISSQSGNLLLYIKRLLLLLLTLFFYTEANGFYIIFERAEAPSGVPQPNAPPKPQCSQCGMQVGPEDTFCEQCGHKLK